MLGAALLVGAAPGEAARRSGGTLTLKVDAYRALRVGRFCAGEGYCSHDAGCTLAMVAYAEETAGSSCEIEIRVELSGTFVSGRRGTPGSTVQGTIRMTNTRGTWGGDVSYGRPIHEQTEQVTFRARTGSTGRWQVTAGPISFPAAGIRTSCQRLDVVITARAGAAAASIHKVPDFCA